MKMTLHKIIPTILTAASLVASVATSSAAIGITPTIGRYDSKVNPRTGTITLDVAAGDVVVLMAATNKKSTISTVSFSTTSGDALIQADIASGTGNDTNPNQWGAYTTITTSGNYDFIITAQINQIPTINWVAYVLHSDAGKTIELLDTATVDHFNLSTGTLDFDSTYTWLGSPDVTIIEAAGSTNGTLTLPAGFTLDQSGGNANSTRTLVHQNISGVSGGFTVAHALTWVQQKAFAGILGFAFAEAVNTEALTLSEAAHDFTFNAASNTFDVASNVSWSWTASDAWITSSEASDQVGDQSFTYSVIENDTGSARSGSITFTATGGTTVTHQVTQGFDPTSPFLSLLPTTNAVDSAAASASFNVTSNTSWSWVSSDRWLTSSEAPNQNNDQVFDYSVSENTSSSERVATITITSTGGIVATHTVTQSGVPFLSVDDSEQDFEASGGTHNIGVSSNASWTWSASASWISSALPSDQVGDVAFDYSVDANPSFSPRVGTITFTGAGDTFTHTVRQIGTSFVDQPGDTGTPVVTTPTNPSSSTRGRYSGFLISLDGTEVMGYIRNLNISSTGRFSASMVILNTTYYFRGEFDANGRFAETIAPRNRLPIDVDFQLATTALNAFHVEGTIAIDGKVGNLSAIKASNTTVRYGKYTILILPDQADTASPQGHGYGTMNVGRRGSATIRGVLADNSRWTARTYITPDAEMPLYSPLYRNKGSLAGMVYFRDISGVSDLDSQVIWHKPGEFNLMRSFIGSKFFNSRRRFIDVAETNPNTQLYLGSGSSIQSWGLEWTHRNRLIYHGSERIRFNISAGLGTITGSIPDGTVRWQTRGVVFQKQNLAAGFTYARGQEPQAFSILPYVPPNPGAN